ncbi:hypothetical protein FB451DRAFT_1187412 [Mycena latifolia]|nr:hypothetical protein FB451DRAFT_1187412 [Mycena latifolia]
MTTGARHTKRAHCRRRTWVRGNGGVRYVPPRENLQKSDIVRAIPYQSLIARVGNDTKSNVGYRARPLRDVSDVLRGVGTPNPPPSRLVQSISSQFCEDCLPVETDKEPESESDGGFYLADSLIAAAQFACFEAQHPRTDKVDVIEYTWHGAGTNVKAFPGANKEFDDFPEYNEGPDTDEDDVESVDDPFHAQALVIYQNDMITGPLPPDGDFDKDLNKSLFQQYAVVKQAAATSKLTLKTRHKDILCKNVPKGTALTATQYEETQGGNPNFATAVAALQDPNAFLSPPLNLPATKPNSRVQIRLMSSNTHGTVLGKIILFDRHFMLTAHFSTKVKAFPSANKEFDDFLEYNEGPDTDEDDVANVDDPFHAQALVIYQNDMITGPLPPDGIFDKDLNKSLFQQYAVVKQAAATSKLTLKTRHKNILCKNVPKGTALTATQYEETQGGNPNFATAVAALQDPNACA